MRFSFKWVALFLVASGFLNAAEVRGKVVHVMRELAMNRNVPEQKDFYLDLGASKGIVVGQEFLAYRVQPITSSISGEPVDFMQLPVGRLRVIAVGSLSSIARVLPWPASESMPKLDYPVIMVGDHVELLGTLENTENVELLEPQSIDPQS